MNQFIFSLKFVKPADLPGFPASSNPSSTFVFCSKQTSLISGFFHPRMAPENPHHSDHGPFFQRRPKNPKGSTDPLTWKTTKNKSPKFRIPRELKFYWKKFTSKRGSRPSGFLDGVYFVGKNNPLIRSTWRSVHFLPTGHPSSWESISILRTFLQNIGTCQPGFSKWPRLDP